MPEYELDNIDRGILHLLQEDARNSTAADIADVVGVAPNTVRNRLTNLEDHDVIQGYYPHIDYERADYQLRVTFVCTVPISERATLAEQTLDIHGIVSVSEVLSGRQNLLVEGIADSSDELTRIASDLEALGITIEGEWFMKNTRLQPFDQFGLDATDE